MSAASERARALLADVKAAHDRLAAVEKNDPTRRDYANESARIAMAGGLDIAEEELQRAASRGGLLAALADEVERLEAERAAPGYKTLHLTETYTDAEAGRHVAALTAENARLRQHEAQCAGVHASPIFVDKTGTLLETIADNVRLREALEDAKISHKADCLARRGGLKAGNYDYCDCEAGDHNAAIDAALRGDGT